MSYAVVAAASYAEDLDRQVGYLLREGVSARVIEGWYGRIRSAIDSLAGMPRLYPVDEFQSRAVGVETRKIVAGDYLAFY